MASETARPGRPFSHVTAAALLIAAVWTGRRACTPALYALNLAGYFSTDCGTVGADEDPNPAIGCLLSAQSEGRAARVMFHRHGIDSPVADVFLRTSSGSSFTLKYDGDIGGGGTHLNPILWGSSCVRFQKITREMALSIGPDLDCVGEVSLPDLCP